MARSRSGGLFVLPNGIEMPTLVKSIQRGTISLSGTSATATITAVNPLNSLLIWSYQDTAGINAADRNAVRIEFTNETTVTALYGATGGTANVSWEVFEYIPGVIKLVQRGTTATGGGSGTTATIAAVNLLKSVVYNLGFTSTDSSVVGLGSTTSRWVFTNATTLNFDTGGAINATGGYQVVEWF